MDVCEKCGTTDGEFYPLYIDRSYVLCEKCYEKIMPEIIALFEALTDNDE